MEQNPIPNQKLEGARLKKRWSLEVASKKIGVTTNTFNRWERGLQIPRLESLDLLCRAFDMSLEELGFEQVVTERRRKNKPEQKATAHPDPHAPADEEQASKALEKSTVTTHTESRNIKSFDLTSQDPGKGERHETTRKQAITLLVGTSSRVFDAAQKAPGSLLYPDEILLVSGANIPLCWQLYFEGGFAELKPILPVYIQQLSALAHQPSRYQKSAAQLASQTHQISYLLALQNQDFGTSLYHTQEALHYGQIAEDINLQAASLARRAYIYFCLQRNGQRLQTYEEVLQLCSTCSPLLRGYIYAGLAEAYASYQDAEHANEFLHLAQKHYPDRPEEDATYTYTHFRWPTFYNFAGQVYLHLQQPEKAWEAFANVDRLVPTREEPYRVELLVQQAATTVILGELEQSSSLLTNAVQSARALGSQLRYNEAWHVYTKMQKRWRNEARVKALQDLFY